MHTRQRRKHSKVSTETKITNIISGTSNIKGLKDRTNTQVLQKALNMIFKQDPISFMGLSTAA